jgi:opacity protein-like surface antigen
MKRYLLLFFLIAFAFWVTAPSVQAQMSTPVILGLKGGINLGTASLSPDLPSGYSKSTRNGVVAGGYAEVGIAEGLYVTGEVLYAQMGLKVASPANPFVGGTVNGTQKSDYIHVPISLKYKFPIPESIIRPYVFGCPSISFNVSSKVVTEYSGQIAQLIGQTSTEEDTKDSTNSVDIAGHLGAGVEFEVSSSVLLFVDGRYSLSFTNASKMASQEIKARNFMIMGGVGLKLP